jgi:hypothetical protein
VYACVTARFHTLNLSSASATCPLGRQKISWDVKGERGPRGYQGRRGNTGPKGSTGATGATGAQGAKGDAGARGASGSQGAKGNAGATGASGSQGAKGDTGATGASGSQGAKGDTGATGTQGPPGPQGPTGATGSLPIFGASGAISNAAIWTGRQTVSLANASGSEATATIKITSAGFTSLVSVQAALFDNGTFENPGIEISSESTSSISILLTGNNPAGGAGSTTVTVNLTVVGIK